MFWEREEHKVAYSWLRALTTWPWSGVLGARRTQSGLQLAPGTHDVAWEWCSGKMHRDSGEEFHTFQRYDFLRPSLARAKRT